MTERTPVSPAQPPAQPQTGSYAPNQNSAMAGKLGLPMTPPNQRAPAPPERDASAGQNPETPAQGERTITLDEMQSLKQKMSSTDAPFFIANPLSRYLSYNYKFKIFMSQDQEFLTGLNSGDAAGDITPGKVFEAIDKAPKVVIAETGVTAGFNIKDVRIESLVAPNMESTNTAATQFVINLEEPLGTSLIETMRNAALELNVRNLDKTFYFLELKFVGYDGETGEADSQIETSNPHRNNLEMIEEQDYDNGGRWIYQIAITNIETELDSSGSRYTITALPYNEGALDHTLSSLPASVIMTGKTIDEFLQVLATSLNEAWEQKFLQKVYTYEFKVHPIQDTGENPGAYTLVPPKPDENAQRSNDFYTANGLPAYLGRMGQSVPAIIETLFSCTQECQDRAYTAWLRSEATNSVSQQEKNEKSGAEASAALYKESRMFRVEPDIEIKGYDYVNKVYRKHITFHIWPFYTQFPITSRAAAENAKSPETQSRLLGELHNRGFFRKRYDYIFTGLNTEVIRLDIRYNLAWTAVLPHIAGANAGFEERTATAKRPEETERQGGEQPENQSGLSTEDLQAAQNNPTGSYQEAVATERRIQEQVNELKLKKEQAQTQQEKKTIQDQIDTLVYSDENRNAGAIIAASRAGARQEASWSEEQDRAAQQSYRSSGDSLFAEDLEEAPDKELPHTISFHYPFNETYNTSGIGMQTPRDSDRGVYGAILEQSYGPMTTGLINIDLEIRGDPYWLAHSNIERRLHMKSGPPKLEAIANMANYMEGDNVFLLNFSYPFNIDDETGDPRIRNNDQGDRMDRFTGLYRAVRVVSTFEGGEFRQTLKAQRFPHLDFAKAMGFDGVHSAASIGDGAPPSASGASTPGGTTQPPAQGGAPVRGANGRIDDSRGVDPKLLRVVERARRDGPYDFDIVDGVRSPAEAEANARAGSGIRRSNHITGDAVDIIPRINGRRVYPEQDPRYRGQAATIYAGINQQMQRAAQAEGVQLTWGGSWQSRHDPGHFELRPGYR